MSKISPVRLRWRRQELLLTTGTYLLGRDGTCHILLDDGRVSRRHARLTVDGALVFIEDLGSMNGILVNGVRVRSRHPLFDGDWLTIGGEEIEICVGDGKRQRQAASTLDSITPVPSGTAQDAERKISEPPMDDEPTQKSRSLEILSNIAERAFATGKLRDAEDLLKTTLLDVRSEAVSGHRIEPETRDFVVRFALRLAEHTGQASWLFNALDVLSSQLVPCSEELEEALRATCDALGNVDVEPLRKYASVLAEHRDVAIQASSIRVLGLIADLEEREFTDR